MYKKNISFDKNGTEVWLSRNYQRGSLNQQLKSVEIHSNLLLETKQKDALSAHITPRIEVIKFSGYDSIEAARELPNF